ncbi:MAG: hypothetical protein COA44_07760 [Arcobacter sp.]|nr:MAG: hypothetical protein COA44_07760 [Arcobacter sp.]
MFATAFWLSIMVLAAFFSPMFLIPVALLAMFNAAYLMLNPVPLPIVLSFVESMCESIEKGMSPWDASVKYQRMMYQCYECKRIYIGGNDGSITSFRPDEETEFGILKKS